MPGLYHKPFGGYSGLSDPFEPRPGYSAGEREDKDMSAAGEVLYLPVPSPARTPFSMFYLKRQGRHEQEQAGRQRIYRLPRHDSPHFAYTPKGYQIPQQGTGKIIDIYA